MYTYGYMFADIMFSIAIKINAYMLVLGNTMAFTHLFFKLKFFYMKIVD